MSSVPELDPVIHAPTRLRIMATLAPLKIGTAITFPRLEQVLDLTSGNLITHLRKLEDAGYITSTTTRCGNGKSTQVALTAEGRDAYLRYRETLRELLA